MPVIWAHAYKTITQEAAVGDSHQVWDMLSQKKKKNKLTDSLTQSLLTSAWNLKKKLSYVYVGKWVSAAYPWGSEDSSIYLQHESQNLYITQLILNKYCIKRISWKTTELCNVLIWESDNTRSYNSQQDA